MSISIDDLKNALRDLVENRDITEVTESDLLGYLYDYVDTPLVTQDLYEEWVNLVRTCPEVNVMSVIVDNSFTSTTDDTVKAWIRTASQYPLLNPFEERELGKKIESGCKESRDKLANHNLRLAITIAKKFRGRGVEFEDLIGDANEGLMKAVDKYDWRRPTKFSTVATWWIRQNVLRAISSKSRSIGVPDYIYYLMGVVMRGENEFYKANGYMPSIAELAALIGETPERVRRAKEIAQQTPSSLQSPIGEDGEGQLEDIVASDDTVEDEMEKILLRDSLIEALTTHLSPKEQDVIIVRFGLNDSVQRTLEEVGKVFGITRERARQIEAKALVKLRGSSHAPLLADFLSNR